MTRRRDFLKGTAALLGGIAAVRPEREVKAEQPPSTVHVKLGRIQSISLMSYGSGYTSPPTITVWSGR